MANKIALVTGGSRGIGKSVALELSKTGITVIVNYNGNKEKAEQVVNEVKEKGGNAESYPCNVGNFCETKEMVDYIIKTYGSLDILVNNAGITRDGLIMKMSEEAFDQVIETNLKGTFHCCKHAARQMLKQRWGRIINMSSVVGVMGNAGQVNYAASKAGVIGLTKSLAKELGSRGITVNAVAPGYIDTDMTAVLSEGVKEKVIQGIPMGRMGTPEDIAYTVAFLASEGAGYITGQVIGVDGGMI